MLWNFLHWKALTKPFITPAEFTALVPICGQQRHAQNDTSFSLGFTLIQLLGNSQVSQPPLHCTPLLQCTTQANRRLGLWNLIFNCFKNSLGHPHQPRLPNPRAVSLLGLLGPLGHREAVSYGVVEGELPQKQKPEFLLLPISWWLWVSHCTAWAHFPQGRKLEVALWEPGWEARLSALWNSWNRKQSPLCSIHTDINAKTAEEMWEKRRVDGCSWGVF